jgi:8-oxo-dGTP pyrophosphatase MutT (NUDIX family)
MKEFSLEQTNAWMANLEKRMSSGAVALRTDDDKVVVVKANYKRYWSFPGGVVDHGETPRQAAAREAEEEVGIAVDVNSLTFKLVVDRVSEIAQTYQFVFEASVRQEDLENLCADEAEIEEIAVISRQQIIDRDRYYSQSTIRWAEGHTGYEEQIFGAGAKAADI